MSSQTSFLFHCVRFRPCQSRQLLSFDITLHRLKFPSSDRYISKCFSNLSVLRLEIICKIDCRIQVTVYHMAAGRADIGSVVQLEVFLDVAAMRTCLRTRVEAVRKNKLNAVRFTFIRHLTAKFVELLRCNFLCEMLILHHAPDIQIFHDDARWLGFHDRGCRLMDMILPNVFQAAMKQSNLLPLPFNISAFSDWPFPDRPADRFFLIPLYGFVMVDVGRKFPALPALLAAELFFKTMNFLRFVDVFKHRLFLLTEKIADSQFFYAKVDPDRFSSQFSVQPVWHLIAKAYIPIFAIKRNSRIRIMTAFRNLRERLSSPHETDFLTVKAAVFACKAFIVYSTLQLLKHNKIA